MVGEELLLISSPVCPEARCLLRSSKILAQ